MSHASIYPVTIGLLNVGACGKSLETPFAFYNQVDQDWWMGTTVCTCAEDVGELDLCKQVESVVLSYFSFTGYNHLFSHSNLAVNMLCSAICFMTTQRKL